jgi:hypothetical protein
MLQSRQSRQVTSARRGGGGGGGGTSSALHRVFLKIKYTMFACVPMATVIGVE